MTKDLTADDCTNPIPVDINDLPSSCFALSADEVHVWHAGLDDYGPDSLRPLLTADELSRADRFHFSKDRNHFVVTRGLLRTLLGGYVRSIPGDLRFVYGEKGKPALEEQQHNSLNFNLAHSYGRAIYAFSRGRAVGVDVESIREHLAGEEIAARFFSPEEIVALKALPPELRHQAFFDCWTRKEAYIKARGDGLSMPLAGFVVSLAPGEAAALLRNEKEPAEVARWRMQSIPVPAGYVAALVAEGHSWSLKMYQLENRN